MNTHNYIRDIVNISYILYNHVKQTVLTSFLPSDQQYSKGEITDFEVVTEWLVNKAIIKSQILTENLESF